MKPGSIEEYCKQLDRSLALSKSVAKQIDKVAPKYADEAYDIVVLLQEVMDETLEIDEGQETSLLHSRAVEILENWKNLIQKLHDDIQNMKGATT